MSWSLIDIPGNFAVVIHGEFDCVNCFHHHVGRSAANYYSTRLTEAQLTSGETGPPLRRCLELIAAQRRPDAVLVLGTCPVEVIGDRFEMVVSAVSAETDIPMLPLHTSGLQLTSQGAMLDWLYSTLVALGQDPEPIHNRVNLVGLPRLDAQCRQILVALDLTANPQFPEVTDFADWRSIGRAQATLSVDSAMTPQLTDTLATLGQRVVDVPYPLGVAQTLAVYEALARVSNRSLPPLTEPEVATRFAGRSAAVGVRMMSTYGTRQLAHGGMAEARALQELGFAVTLVVQGAPESAKVFAATLAKLGADFPFRIFPGPWALAEHLVGHDLCILSDSSRQEAQAAGVPMLASGALRPWWSGVADNIAMLAAL